MDNHSIHENEVPELIAASDEVQIPSFPIDAGI